MLKNIPELSPNLQAFPFVKQLLDYPERFRVMVKKINGVSVIDCGVDVLGGWEAGVIFANICLGGLAKINLHWEDFAGLRWPAIEVITDHPVRSCMASQYAGWFVKKDKFSAMGSGPARAVLSSEELFIKLGYKDSSDISILCLESRKLPTEEAIDLILEKCGCEPNNLYILVAPTASMVGSVQIAARSVETGLHKLLGLGYDIGNIDSGWGISPLPPVAADDLIALGRTNDAILYGTTVQYNLQDEDERLKSIITQVPSSSSKDYGQPFRELFERYGNFYDIDPLLFSPAKVCLSNRKSGRSFWAGEICSELLKKSFELEF